MCSYIINFAAALVRALEYSLPSDIAEHVLSVFNVADFPVTSKSHVKKGRQPTPAELANTMASPAGTIIKNYVTPALLSQVYHIGSNTGSSLVSQGVYETSNQWFSPSDLTTFQSAMGLPSQPIAVDIGGHSANNACSAQGEGNCLEGNLDTQYIMGVSQGTPTTYYYIDENNFILDWLVSVAKLSSPPLVLSVSWGSAESYYTAAYMTSVNNEAIILSAMGVSLFASSGDDGANAGGTTCGYMPSFPASSAYFTAVGATNVTYSCL